MDETKPKQPWTPGEWRSDYDEVDAFSDIYAVGQGGNGCSLHIVDVRGPNAKADGKLMAAAPAMARALAEMVTAFEDTQQAPDDGSSVRWVRLICSAEKARDVLDAAGWQWGGR